MEDPYAAYTVNKRTWIPQMRRRSIPLAQIFKPNYNTPKNFRIGEESRDNLEFLRPLHPPNLLFQRNQRLRGDPKDYSPAEINPDDLEEFYPMMNYISKLRTTTEDFRKLPVSDRYSKLKSLLNDFATIERPEDIDVDNLLLRQINEDDASSPDNSNAPERFTLTYNPPDKFPVGWDNSELLEDDIPESRVYVDETDEDYPEEYGSGAHTEQEEIFRELKQLHKQEQDAVREQISVRSNDDEIFRELKNLQKEDEDGNLTELPRKIDKNGNVDSSGLYTEGGVVYPPESKVTGK